MLERHKFHGSSRVTEGWYRPDTRTVVVEFVDGVLWQYDNVSRSTWNDFMESASPGTFIHRVLDGYVNGPADKGENKHDRRHQ